VLFALPEAVVQAAVAMAGRDGSEPVWRDVSVGISSVLLLPFVSALGLVCFGLLLVEMGIGCRLAALSMLLVGIASPLLPYAKFHQEENQIVALTCASAMYALRFANRSRLSDGLLAGLLCWAPMWFRPTAIAESLPLACLVLWSAWSTGALRPRVVALAGVFASGAATAAWLLYYNWYRFGSAFETGYQQIYAQNGLGNGSLLAGVLGPFVNPSKSIVIYSPLLLVAAAGALKAWRHPHGRAILLGGLATLTLSIAIPARFKIWGGDSAWGPRYQVAGHLLLLALVPFALTGWSAKAPAARRFVLAAVATGVFVQALAVPFNFNLEYNLGLRRTWDYRSIAEWYTTRAQIPLRIESLTRSPEMWTTPSPRPAEAVDEYLVPAFLPWKLGQRFGTGAWSVAVAVWLAALLAWLVATTGFVRSLRDRAR
jgi:hypothetical protein